ncbi:MAG: phosphatidate cytidylyltransferase [Verrucomicrobiales bacterium]|nr:phosphatidate cytidylyltransferase [Verrucomicrobiales bacterium]
MPDDTAADSHDAPAENAPNGSPPPSENSDKGSAKRRAFKSRLISTLILIAILVPAFVFSQDWLYSVLFAIISLGALIEYFRLFPIRGFRRFRWQTYGVSVAYIVLLFAPIWGFEAKWLSELDGLAVALLVTLVVLERLRSPIEGFRTLDEIAATIFGFIYCVLLFAFIPKILMLPLTNESGENSAHFYLIYLIAVTKLTDMGAYLVGSLIGRDKMVPHVSPGKTWQGFGGAIAFAVAGSFTLYFAMGDQIPIITPVHAGILAILLALVAVLGDLAESILKRSLEAKDSGAVMPGIGGFLDLIDSIIFTAPLFYIYLLIFK